jgi:hypothetical protein
MCNLRRCGALLTTGWAGSSGSPDESTIRAPVNTRSASNTQVLSADHADTNLEQLLWNQCRGNLATQMLPLARIQLRLSAC